MDGDGELTAQETALYDRQIRVWGVDAQKKLSKSHVLVSGLSGAAVEFCKNITLAGVASLTLVDDRPVTEDALQANFLISPVEAFYKGRTIAELCCDSLKDFNPMVRVSTENGNLAHRDDEFFDKYDAVIVSSCSFKTKKMINEKCRKRSKRVAFYVVDCRDSCGEIFVDLQKYSYSQKKSNDTEEHHADYPSLEEATSIKWKALPRKVSKLYFAMRVIERFEMSRLDQDEVASTSDLPALLDFRKELCETQSVSEEHIPSSLLERLLAADGKEHPAVCAILGGILGQEVIKALSGKGDPFRNFFYFDTADGRGVIEDISNPSN